MALGPTPPRAPGGEESDPSMDDILASIRRILDDDPAGQKPADDVLVLDPSMMVEDPDEAGTPAPEPQEPLDAEIAPLEAEKDMVNKRRESERDFELERKR